MPGPTRPPAAHAPRHARAASALCLLGLATAAADIAPLEPAPRAELRTLLAPSVLSDAGPRRPAGRPAPPLEHTLSVALDQIAAQRYTDAAETLREATREHPDDLRPWFLLAAAALGAGNTAETLAATNRCLRINPKWQPAWWLRGLTLATAGRIDEAARAYDQAVHAAPDRPAGYFQRARFVVLHRPEEPAALKAALADLERARRLGLQGPALDALLGAAFQHLHQPRQAEDHLKRAVVADPARIDALRALVRLYDEQGRFDEADRWLARTRDRRDGWNADAQALCALIEAQHAQRAGRAAGRIERFYRQASATPGACRRDATLQYARWLERVGRICDAVPLLRRLFDQAPGDAEVAAHLAWVLAECGRDLPLARRCVSLAQRKLGASPYLADTVAWIEFRAGNVRQALSLLTPALPEAASTPEIAWHAGAIYARLGQRARAIRYLRMSLASQRCFSGRPQAEKLLDDLTRHP